MKIKCLVVDDEPLAVNLIENHISNIEGFVVVATCNSAIKAFEVLNTQQIDLLFLDIKMPNITGVDFLKTLRYPPKTILTTAYRDYAIDGYDLGVIDYLLKPITFERFMKSIDRFLNGNNTKPSHAIQEDSELSNDSLIVKSGTKHHKIKVNQILYIESLKDYIKIHLEGTKHIVSKYKISNIEEDLGKYSFLRVHRSFIINTDQVTAFTAQNIEISNTEIPIGGNYKDHVLSFLKKESKG